MAQIYQVYGSAEVYMTKPTEYMRKTFKIDDQSLY